MNKSTPLVNASVWSLLEARPVRATMNDGLRVSPSLRLRDSSISRIALVASKPFIIGIDISGV